MTEIEQTRHVDVPIGRTANIAVDDEGQVRVWLALIGATQPFYCCPKCDHYSNRRVQYRVDDGEITLVKEECLSCGGVVNLTKKL